LIFKKKILIFISFAIFFNNIFSYYQNIIINNKEIASGQRDISASYSVIQDFLKQYKRPFTILDLGAAQGAFSFKIASEFDASCVMVEDDLDYNHSQKLLELCHLNTTLKNIIFLKQRVTSKMLNLLGSCEHFDVTLALNFIHHCGGNTKAILEALTTLGDYLIVENPPCDEFPKNHRFTKTRVFIEEFLLSRGGKIIASVPRHTTNSAKSKIIVLKTSKNRLLNKNIIWNLYGKPKRELTIQSTFNEKYLIKKKGNKQIKSKWVPGINLLTFKCLNGVFPTVTMLEKMINDVTKIEHPDWGPANMIIQGKYINLIDFDPFGTAQEQRKRQNFRQKLMDKFINLHGFDEIAKFYWTEFTPVRD
jgi:hypothetical protein